MAHAQQHSSGFGSFLLGVLLTLAVVAAMLVWSGTHTPFVRTAALDTSTISIPLPRLPPPPGTVPKAHADATH